MLRIVGTGFQLPADPPASGSGPVPEAPATVRVLVGGVEARRVRVASSTVLYVTTERRDPAAGLAVEVRNVGPHGETIGAEVATLAAAYEYARPVFTTASDLERLVRALHAELVRQVFPDVVITAHVDWDDDPASALRAVDAPMPCVFLAGPVLRPNPVLRTNVRPRVEVAENVLLEHRAPETDDVVFVVGAQADKYQTLLSLTAALRDFKIRNPKLELAVEEGSDDVVEFELVWEGDLTVDSSSDESNVRTCSGTLAIVGVDTLAAPGFENDQAITANPDLLEDPELETERHG